MSQLRQRNNSENQNDRQVNEERRTEEHKERSDKINYALSHSEFSRLKSETLRNLRDVFLQQLSTIDMVQVSQKCANLLKKTEELNNIRSIISKDFSRLESYRKILNEIRIECANDIQEISNQLIDSNYMEFFEVLRDSGRFQFLGISKEHLPITEKSLVYSLLLEDEEIEILWKIFEALLSGTSTDETEEEDTRSRRILQHVLRETYDIIETTLPPYQTENSDKSKCFSYVSGLGKIACGVGLIGLNCSGFLSTSGLLITTPNIIASTLTGGSQLLDGTNDLMKLRNTSPE